MTCERASQTPASGRLFSAKTMAKTRLLSRPASRRIVYSFALPASFFHQLAKVKGGPIGRPKRASDVFAAAKIVPQSLHHHHHFLPCAGSLIIGSQATQTQWLILARKQLAGWLAGSQIVAFNYRII